MRILIAIHGFPPTHYAGAERAAERYAKWLAVSGYDVQVFTIENLNADHERLEETSYAGLTVYRLHYNLYTTGDTFHNLYDHPAVGTALRDLLARQHYDLVHVISGYLLGGQVIHTAHEAGLKVVLTLTEYWFMCKQLNLLQPTGELCIGPESDAKCARCIMEEKRRYRLPALTMPAVTNYAWKLVGQYVRDETEQAVSKRRQTLRTALDAVDRVISPSNFLITKFADFGFNTRNYVCIEHGLASIPVPTKSSNHGSSVLRLGYIGQLKRHKGIDLAVDALLMLNARNAPVSLDIWGPEDEGVSYVQRLQSKAHDHDNIHWHGRYDHSQLGDILSAMDALIVPSRWYENYPTVILEAFALQIPVIATNLGGMAEMVQHEVNGLLFTLNDPADLAHQINRILEEPGLLEHLQEGIAPIKTVDDEMRDIVAQYERVLSP